MERQKKRRRASDREREEKKRKTEKERECRRKKGATEGWRRGRHSSGGSLKVCFYGNRGGEWRVGASLTHWYCGGWRTHTHTHTTCCSARGVP